LRLQRPVKTSHNQFCAVFFFSKLQLTVNQTVVLTEDWSIPFAVLIGYGPVWLWFFSGFVTGLPNTSCVGCQTDCKVEQNAEREDIEQINACRMEPIPAFVEDADEEDEPMSKPSPDPEADFPDEPLEEGN